jgi:hypothetical protein
MELKEALEISNACELNLYPPTNISLLSNAMSVIYNNKGNSNEIGKIAWWIYYLNQLENMRNTKEEC